MHNKIKYCPYCGSKYSSDEWPRSCHCENILYVNPKPVTAMVVPINDGILIAQRNIEPCKGGWAFPGGYMELNETWQEGACRELFEETGVEVDPSKINLLDVLPGSNKTTVMIFGIAPKFKEIPRFILSDETMNIRIINKYEKLCFNSHDHILKYMFSLYNLMG